MGREVRLGGIPTRIISIVPSQTELLADLGADEQVAGITKYCVHPESWRKQKTIVGGTKKLSFSAIRQLQPDLIIGNKEENSREDIELLQKEFPVWMSEVNDLEDALTMTGKIGEVVGKREKAAELSADIHARFQAFKLAAAPAVQRDLPSAVLYLIWRKPWMAAGKGTFIDSMLSTIGLENAMARMRYPRLKDDDIRAVAPATIFLSSEPYPFREKHINELNKLCPDSKIYLVDGEMFSWYGSRLLHAPAYFSSLLQRTG